MKELIHNILYCDHFGFFLTLLFIFGIIFTLVTLFIGCKKYFSFLIFSLLLTLAGLIGMINTFINGHKEITASQYHLLVKQANIVPQLKSLIDQDLKKHGYISTKAFCTMINQIDDAKKMKLKKIIRQWKN